MKITISELDKTGMCKFEINGEVNFEQSIDVIASLVHVTEVLKAKAKEATKEVIEKVKRGELKNAPEGFEDMDVDEYIDELINDQIVYSVGGDI